MENFITVVLKKNDGNTDYFQKFIIFYIRMQVGKANISLVPGFGPVIKRVEGLLMASARMTGVTKIPPVILSRLLGLRYNNSRLHLQPNCCEEQYYKKP